MNERELEKINRIEVVDQTGRAYVHYLNEDESVRYSLQDDDQTLKIFIDKSESDCSPTNCSPCELCEDEQKWAAHYKEQRDFWIERFRKALEVHAGTIHCREDCNCTNRKTLRELESFLPEHVPSKVKK